MTDHTDCAGCSQCAGNCPCRQACEWPTQENTGSWVADMWDAITWTAISGAAAAVACAFFL